MKISDLEKRLAELREEHGDVETMIGTDDGVYGMEYASIHHRVVTDGDEYPEDWKMPKGFEFIEIAVYH